MKIRMNSKLSSTEDLNKIHFRHNSENNQNSSSLRKVSKLRLKNLFLNLETKPVIMKTNYNSNPYQHSLKSVRLHKKIQENSKDNENDSVEKNIKMKIIKLNENIVEKQKRITKSYVFTSQLLKKQGIFISKKNDNSQINRKEQETQTEISEDKILKKKTVLFRIPENFLFHEMHSKYDLASQVRCLSRENEEDFRIRSNNFTMKSFKNSEMSSPRDNYMKVKSFSGIFNEQNLRQKNKVN